MKTDYKTEARDDGSVIVEVGNLTAHIKGASWGEANEAARTFALAVNNRRSLEEARVKLSTLSATLDDLSKLLKLARPMIEDATVETRTVCDAMSNLSLFRSSSALTLSSEWHAETCEDPCCDGCL